MVYEAFEAIRWPDVVTCPHCAVSGRCRLLRPRDGSPRRTRTGRVTHRRVWRCNACRRQFSVLTGTIFQGTRVPLQVWLSAIDACGPDGVTARRVAAVTGVEWATARSMARLVNSGLDAGRAAATL